LAVFDKLRRAVSDKVAEVREESALPPDAKAVPDVGGTDFGSLDPAVLSAYLGREVTSIEPIGALGAQATSMLGRRLQERLRADSGALEPGEMIPGQAAAREARMRDAGMSDEQVAMASQHIVDAMAEHHRDGWDVIFANGHRASVQVDRAGTEAASEYDRIAARWDRENGTDGHKPQDTPLLMATVHRSTASPYESYCLEGKLFARSETHVAVAQSDRVGNAVLDALAAIALVAATPGSPSR
jgi:hypothetical protein